MRTRRSASAEADGGVQPSGANDAVGLEALDGDRDDALGVVRRGGAEGVLRVTPPPARPSRAYSAA